MEKVLKQYLGTVEDKSDEEGTFVVAISTEDKDRADEILKANGFELGNFRKNPVVLWAHDYGSPPIAKALWVKAVANKLKAKLQFAKTQFAQEIKMLYEEGFLKAWSVGFVPKKWKDGEEGEDVKRTYTKVELLEFSAVPVPCNPMALSEAIKMVKDVKLKEILEKEVENQEPEDIAISVEGEEGKHEGHKEFGNMIEISEEQGIKADYCADCKKVIAYQFDKDNGLKKEEAQEWVKEHSENIVGIVADAAEDWDIIEANISKYLETGKASKDDDEEKVKCQNCGVLIDYEKEPEVAMGAIECPECKATIDQEGTVLPDESKNLVKISDSLLEFEEGKIDRKEILGRIEDSMVDVIQKVGAVLSKKNKQKLVVARENIQSILDAAEINSDDDGKVVSNEDIIEAIKALKEVKEIKKKEIVKIDPLKEKDKKKEILEAEIQDVKATVRNVVGEHLDKSLREIRKNLLGKIQ